MPERRGADALRWLASARDTSDPLPARGQGIPVSVPEPSDVSFLQRRFGDKRFGLIYSISITVKHSTTILETALEKNGVVKAERARRARPCCASLLLLSRAAPAPQARPSRQLASYGGLLSQPLSQGFSPQNPEAVPVTVAAREISLLPLAPLGSSSANQSRQVLGKLQKFPILTFLSWCLNNIGNRTKIFVLFETGESLSKFSKGEEVTESCCWESAPRQLRSQEGVIWGEKLGGDD